MTDDWIESMVKVSCCPDMLLPLSDNDGLLFKIMQRDVRTKKKSK